MGLFLWAVTWFFIGVVVMVIHYRMWINRLGLKGHIAMALEHTLVAVRMMEHTLLDKNVPEDIRKEMADLLMKMDQFRRAVVSEEE